MMHTGRLILTPRDPFHAPPEVQTLLKRLRDLEFCAEPLTGLEGQHYRLGDRFMQLVTFMGCSPHIELEPTSDGKPFCHMILEGPHPSPRFLQGRNTGSPRCGNCRRPIPQWRDEMEAWGKDPKNHLASCPHCGHRENPASYNWRQSAGSGRLFVMVENIFPSEAIPSEELLRALQGRDEEAPWRYFYIQD